MPNLKVRPSAEQGQVHDVTPASAGWTYVGFALHRLAPGERVEAACGERETCLVLVAGKAKVSADGKAYGEIGERLTPFEGAPFAVYVPAGGHWQVEATTALELAVCTAPGGGDHPARLIPPGTHPQAVRGKATNTRYVTNIMP